MISTPNFEAFEISTSETTTPSPHRYKAVSIDNDTVKKLAKTGFLGFESLKCFNKTGFLGFEDLEYKILLGSRKYIITNRRTLKEKQYRFSLRLHLRKPQSKRFFSTTTQTTNCKEFEKHRIQVYQLPFPVRFPRSADTTDPSIAPFSYRTYTPIIPSDSDSSSNPNSDSSSDNSDCASSLASDHPRFRFPRSSAPTDPWATPAGLLRLQTIDNIRLLQHNYLNK